MAAHCFGYLLSFSVKSKQNEQHLPKIYSVETFLLEKTNGYVQVITTMVVNKFISQNFVNFHVKIVITAINRDFGRNK